MPIVNGNDMQPDDAVAQGLCPECARPLAETNPEEHIAAHWPRGMSDEARRRAELIRSHAKKQADEAAANVPPEKEKE